MHDDSCKAYAQGTVSGVTVHCWLNPDHQGLHYDVDLGIYWRKGMHSVPVTAVPKAKPPKRRGFGAPRLAAAR